MRVASKIALLLAVAASPLLAQTGRPQVDVPSRVNGTAATVARSAGAAAAAAPAAHEVPAQIVGPSAPAAIPFAQGVTRAGREVSGGLTKTGDNIAAGGVTVYPTNSLSSKNRQTQLRAAGDAAAQARKAVPEPDRLKCDAQELATGECQ